MPDWTTLLAWIGTYWLHSTLLLAGTWLWTRCQRPTSHALIEAAWKLAAVGAFLTTSMQLSLGIESPLNVALRTAWPQPKVNDVRIGQQESATHFHTIRDQATPGSRSALIAHDKVVDDKVVDDKVHPAATPFDDGTQLIQTQSLSNEVELIGQSSEFNLHSDQTNAQTLELRESSPIPSRASALEDFSWFAAARRVSTLIITATGGSILALCLFGLIKLTVNHWGFVTRMQSCVILPHGRARDLLDQLLIEAKIRRKVTLLLADDEMEPGAWGLLLWRIVLPPRAVDELTQDELQALLAHELAHLVRGDQWWIWIGQILTTCLAWQPLNRLAFREWRHAAEYLSDAWAVERRVTRLSLARCLTTVAEWRLSSIVPLAGVGGEHRSSLSQRIERLVDETSLKDPWMTRSRRQLLAAAGCFIAVTTTCCAPAAMLHAEPERTFTADTSAHLTEQTAKQWNSGPNNVVEVNDTSPNFNADVFQSDPGTQVHSPAAADEFNENINAIALNVDERPRHQLTHVILHEVSVDLQGLITELSELDDMLAQSARLRQTGRIQLRIQHFRVQLQRVTRIRENLSAQLQL